MLLFCWLLRITAAGPAHTSHRVMCVNENDGKKTAPQWSGLTFALGAVGYGGLELLWRGRTHWTMLLCGGVGLLFLARLARQNRPLWQLALLGGIGITGLELAAGLVVNCLLHWNVWDYSTLWGNLWGQVCPVFAAAWVGLSGVVLAALRFLQGVATLPGRRAGKPPVP